MVALGIFSALLRFSPSDEGSDVRNRELLLSGRFIQGAGLLSERSFQTFEIEAARNGESGEDAEELHGKEMRIFSEFEADYDETYELFVKTGPDGSRMNPGGNKHAGLYGSVIAAKETPGSPPTFPRMFENFRADINLYLSNRFEKDSAALISAVTTGEKALLKDDLREAFNRAGLAHMLSISGTHFGLFSILLFGLFVYCIRRLPSSVLQRLTIYLTPSQASALLSFPFMIMYLGISGASVPAVRSFVMISLFLAGILLGRKGQWLNTVLIAASILVLADPPVILTLSFQLSFIAVLFIGFSLEKTSAEEAEERGFRRVVRNSVAITLAAVIGTSPLAAYHFHYFSLIAPLSNLFVAPLIGFVVIPSSVISSLSLVLTGHFIFAPLVQISSDLSVWLVKLVADIPYASVRIPAFPPVLCLAFYAGFLLYLISGRDRRFLVLPVLPFLAFVIIGVAGKKELGITFLDVGQGDSAVIEFPDGRIVVVDTGRTGRETASFLAYRGKEEIDALVLTHIHPDHSGGLAYLMDRFSVREIWDNGMIEYPEELNIGDRHRVLERGDIIETKYGTITVLHPYTGFNTLEGSEYDEENNASLVLKVAGKTGTCLLAGDIQEEAEDDISFLGRRLKSDVIKVPHHGSRTSGQAEFLSAVSPSFAVISVGRDNSFGHPSPEMLERLGSIRVLRTDLDGAVKMTGTESGFEVKTWKDCALEKADSPSKELRNFKRLFLTW
jgi:competence protein ComEC